MTNERITEVQLNALRHIGTEWTFALDAWRSLARDEATSLDFLAAYAMFRVLAKKGLIEGSWDRSRSTTRERLWRLTAIGQRILTAAKESAKMANEITPEELETQAGLVDRGLVPDGWSALLLKRAASAIRALQAKLAEAERRAMPEGWIPLCVVSDNDSLAQEQAFSIERSTEPGNESRWRVFFGKTRIGDVAGYKILADAIRATETAVEEADHAE